MNRYVSAAIEECGIVQLYMVLEQVFVTEDSGSFVDVMGFYGEASWKKTADCLCLRRSACC